jgi:hypothetical protein
VCLSVLRQQQGGEPLAAADVGDALWFARHLLQCPQGVGIAAGAPALQGAEDRHEVGHVDGLVGHGLVYFE